MKDITNRDDVMKLITTFYAKVRKDELLGPIFNSIVKDWDSHNERIANFWETNLFFIQKYKGNPLEVHREVDARVNNTVSELHFGRWLLLWIETIDQLFAGKYADLAKNRARKMSTFLFLKIFEARGNKEVL